MTERITAGFIFIAIMACGSDPVGPDYEPVRYDIAARHTPEANPALGLANVEADKPLFDELNRRGLQCTAYHYPKHTTVDLGVDPPVTTKPFLTIAMCDRYGEWYSIQEGNYTEVENVYDQEGYKIPVADRRPVGYPWTAEMLAYYEHAAPAHTTRFDPPEDKVAVPVEAAFDSITLTMTTRSTPGTNRDAWAWVLKGDTQVNSRGAALVWRSSNTRVATIMASGGKMATITAKAVGETTISVSATDPVTHKTHRADKTHYVRETYDEPLNP